MAPLVYLDSNVFIYLKEAYGERSDRLVDMVAAGARIDGVRLLTSELTLAELLVAPIAKGQDDLTGVYDALVVSSDWLRVAPISRDVLLFSARIRAAAKSIKLPDAIHIATALAEGCRYLLTGDTGLKGRYSLPWASSSLPLNGGDVAVVRPEPDVLERLIAELAPS